MTPHPTDPDRDADRDAGRPIGRDTGRDIDVDIDLDIDRALDGPMLQVPDDFDARVLAALPARPVAAEPPVMTARPPARPPIGVWRVLQALVLAACGALGAVEVLLFVGGLWTATAVAVG